MHEPGKERKGSGGGTEGRAGKKKEIETWVLESKAKKTFKKQP